MGGGVALCDFENGLFGGRVADDERRLGIADEIIHLVKAIGCVHGQKDKAAAQTGKINAKRFRGFLHLQRHAIPGLEPALRKKNPNRPAEVKQTTHPPSANPRLLTCAFMSKHGSILGTMDLSERNK